MNNLSFGKGAYALSGKLFPVISRIMKVTTALMLIFMTCAYGSGKAQKISLSLRNATLEEAFKEISKQTSYTFLYNDAVIRQAKKIDVEFESKNLNEALSQLLASNKMVFKIIDRTITVNNQIEKERIPSIVTDVQNRITGRVKNTAGTPLSGATVVVKGSAVGTITDGDGAFSIQASKEEIIIVRYIGYLTKEVKIDNQKDITITLISDDELDEVVVVGYGTGSNLSTVVGSVAKVSSKEISGKPRANVLEALQGRVPGLQVFTSNGEPSATQSIRLDGTGSLSASSTPLFVLDGVPVNSGSLVSMNPEDFESVTVLKDASATSIYGSRAANGVIYFTSKKGKIGERANIMARTQFGNSNLALSKMQDKIMTKDQLLSFWKETGNQTEAQIEKIKQDWPYETDWLPYYFRKSQPVQTHDVSISGGSQKTTYYLSSNFYKEDGLMYRSAFDRVTLRSNVSSRLNDWIRLGVNLSGGYDRRETNGWGANSTNGGISLLAPPWYTPYDADGNEYYDTQIPGLGRWNPKYLADKQPSQGRNQQFNPIGFVEITPITGLTLKSQAGLDYFIYRGTSQRLASYKPNIGNGTRTESTTTGAYRTITNTIEYKFNLKDVHKFTTLVGHEFSDYSEEAISSSGSGITDDRLSLLSSTTGEKTVSQTKTEFAYNSFFGRVGYYYNEKYSAEGTLRNDASSRFGKENRNALFWSLGFMWNAKNENFLKDVSWLTDLKARASIGTAGNSSIGNYQSLATVGTAIYGGGTAWGITSPGNPQLAWETQTKTTIGITANLFDRVELEAEYFKRITNNMLVSVPFPYTSGFADVTSNIGKLENNGVNVRLSFNVFKSTDYYLTPFVNIGYVKQEIKELFQGKQYWIIPNTMVSWVVGRPVEYFLPLQKGVNPDNGLMEWYLPGDDISITQRDPNKVTSTFNESALQQSSGIKRHAPLNGGFGLNSGYKGFYLNALFSFSSGKYMVNNDAYFFENPFQFRTFNQSSTVLDYWKKPGDVTTFPKWGEVNQFDSRLLQNASFMRLKSLEIGYSLPKSLLQKNKFFKDVRVFYVGRNLLTFTKYEGPDPEADVNLTYGVNPNTKQNTFGVQVNF